MNEYVIKAEDVKTTKELAQKIAQAKPYSVVRFIGEFNLTVSESNTFLIGKTAKRNLVELHTPFVTYDGEQAMFEIIENEGNRNDIAFLFLWPDAEGTVIRNLCLRMRGRASNGGLIAIYNTAYNVTVKNCDIKLESDVSENLTAIYNNGNFNTHMDTRADNLIISENRIFVRSLPENPQGEHECVGIKNIWANSISVSGNYLNVSQRGTSDAHKAIGIYNTGRFMRISDNNIKANGTHNKGMQLEQATAIAVLNEGLYTLLSNNNIVAEWAGTAIALWNKSEYCKATGNKILATHTIKGRSVITESHKTVLSANIITSTSRNARLVEVRADDAIISDNFMQALVTPDDAQSGVGVFAVGCKNLMLTDNIIKDTSTCGVYLEESKGTIRGNICAGCGRLPYAEQADEFNLPIKNVLYRTITSIEA